MRKGIGLHRKKLCWQVKPAPWWWWIPGQRPLLKVWNFIACHIWGHNKTAVALYYAGYIRQWEVKCSDCMATLDPWAEVFSDWEKTIPERVEATGTLRELIDQDETRK